MGEKQPEEKDDQNLKGEGKSAVPSPETRSNAMQGKFLLPIHPSIEGVLEPRHERQNRFTWGGGGCLEKVRKESENR